MKKCPDCGEEVSDEVVVCQRCGRHLGIQQATIAETSLGIPCGGETVSKVTSHCVGMAKTYKSVDLPGRQFRFPDQCARCGKSPAPNSVAVTGTVLTWNATLHFCVAVPVCCACFRKNPKPASFVKYASGCRSLAFSNRSFQTNFEAINPKVVDSYDEFIAQLGKA